MQDRELRSREQRDAESVRERALVGGREVGGVHDRSNERRFRLGLGHAGLRVKTDYVSAARPPVVAERAIDALGEASLARLRTGATVRLPRSCSNAREHPYSGVSSRVHDELDLEW